LKRANLFQQSGFISGLSGPLSTKLLRKRHFPEIPVVVGGPQVTLFPEQIFAECSHVSLVLRGEADFTFAELATRLEEKKTIANIPGIMMRNNEGQIHYGPPPEPIQDLDSIPFPARHVYAHELYNPIPMMLSLPYMVSEQVITSRGCEWRRCRFCYQSNPNMPHYRRRSPENVIAELRMLVDDYKVGFIVFNDDNFLFDEPWIERFCELYRREKFTFKWHAVGRVVSVTPSMLLLVAQCGCVHVTYGFESGNQETLNLIQKGTTLEQARNAVKWAHKAGLLVRGNILFGLPRETPEMAKKTIEFVKELDIDFVGFVPYHVLENTPLEEIALKEGHCIEHDNLSLITPSYIPDTYDSAEEINRILREAFWSFYLRPRYIAKVLWWVKNPRVWPSLFTRLVIAGKLFLYMRAPKQIKQP